MKKLILIFTMSIFCMSASASEGKLTYGKGANMKLLTPVSKVLKTPDLFKDKDVTISGRIVDVCTHRGCWMKLSSDKKYQTLRIKVKDGDMVFPLTAKGRMAFATGKLKGSKLSKEKAIKYLSYLAKESKESFDPKSVKGPMTIYQLIPHGVTIE